MILWSCANDDNLQEVLPVNSENTEESLYLENGNEVIIYSNGVAVEKLPDGRIVWDGTGLEPFDSHSIMIYGSCEAACALTEGVSYMWKKSDGSTWNVNDTDLSEMDIFTLNTVYSKPHYTITCNTCTLSGTVRGTGRYAKGEICALQAFPEDNRGFLGWFDGDKKISSSNIYLVQVTSDKTYEARFTYPINVHCEISVTKNSLGKPLGTTSADSFGTSTGNAVTIVVTPNFRLSVRTLAGFGYRRDIIDKNLLSVPGRKGYANHGCIQTNDINYPLIKSPCRILLAGDIIFSFSRVFYNRFSGITESFFSFVNTSLHT